MDTFALKGKLSPAAGQELPGEIQGGAVNPAEPGFIYLSINANCSIYKMDLNTGEVRFVLSDDYAHRPHEYEMEGITFWDLRDHTPNFGVMHFFGNFMTVKEKGIRSYTPVV